MVKNTNLSGKTEETKPKRIYRKTLKKVCGSIENQEPIPEHHIKGSRRRAAAFHSLLGNTRDEKTAFRSLMIPNQHI